MLLTNNNLKKKFPKKIKNFFKAKRISDDFMKYWHSVLHNNYSIVDKFNHEYVVNSRPKNFKKCFRNWCR